MPWRPPLLFDLVRHKPSKAYSVARRRRAQDDGQWRYEGRCKRAPTPDAHVIEQGADADESEEGQHDATNDEDSACSAHETYVAADVDAVQPMMDPGQRQSENQAYDEHWDNLHKTS